jgi:hypothetical protein
MRTPCEPFVVIFVVIFVAIGSFFISLVNNDLKLIAYHNRRPYCCNDPTVGRWQQDRTHVNSCDFDWHYPNYLSLGDLINPVCRFSFRRISTINIKDAIDYYLFFGGNVGRHVVN